MLRFAETLMVGSICSFGCSAADGHGGETGTIGAASAGAGDWAGHCYDNPGKHQSIQHPRRSMRLLGGLKALPQAEMGDFSPSLRYRRPASCAFIDSMTVGTTQGKV
ncbi:MAG TPA: hypothetical protein VLJ17_17600 [Xanthobacteraceae bacterium]|nr:hypothetical protein [Xanthobacteraceae bacterium]